MAVPSDGTRPLRQERGQTGFDFLVGMSVFLITVGAVFTFTPGMFEPFDTGTGPSMVVADRSAALLAGDLLVEDVSRPGVLDTTCTVDFFDTGSPDDPDCRFTQDGSDLNAALDVDDATGLNVTVESSGSILEIDNKPLAAGRTPPATAEIVVGKRSVMIGEVRGTLLVRVW